MLKNLLVLVFVSLAHLASAQQNIDATIQGGVVRPITLAIPAFTDETGSAGETGRQMSAVVANDLRSTGLFRDLPAESFIAGNEAFSEAVDFASWNGIGAELYLKGAIAGYDEENITIKFRIYDVVAQAELGEGMQLSGPKEDWRPMAHKVSDEIYSRYTGEGPYFDSRIVFVAEAGTKAERRKAIAIMDTDGANLEYLTDGTALVLAPQWAGNTRDIIFTSYESGTPQIVLMNTETREVQVFEDLPGVAFSPRLSPDGKTLLMSMIDDTGNTDLYTVDLASGARQRLTSAPSIETSPSYSPDGEQIVFESDRSGTQQLYIMPAKGGDAKQISNGEGRYATPVWSPRGDLIAYTKIFGDQFHIGMMNIDGSDEREISASFIDEGPTWAPNGRVLMFFRETAGEGGAPKLQSISLTGRNMVEIQTPDFASDPNWSELRP